MFTFMIVVTMLLGLGIGFRFFSRPGSEKIRKAMGIVQQISTAALLFAMGLSLGTSEIFWREIGAVGLQGIVIAVLAVVGSVVGCRIVYAAAFGKGRNR